MIVKIFLISRVVLWCGLIFYLSSIPNLGTGLGIWDFVLRKIAHMVVFGVLFLFSQSAAIGAFGQHRKKAYFYAVVFSIMYAISDEYHQTFVPGRHGTVTDVIINFVGIAIALSFKLKHSRGKITRQNEQ